MRDAQIGTLWEGTSNINALDVVQRAVGKSGGHKTLSAALKDKVERSQELPGQYKGLLGATLDRVGRSAEAHLAQKLAPLDAAARRRLQAGLAVLWTVFGTILLVGAAYYFGVQRGKPFTPVVVPEG